MVERDNLFYKKFTNIPFSGEISGKENGKFKNGRRYGEWISYHENGQLKSEGNYKDGEKDTHLLNYATVTDFAKFLGLSMSVPLYKAV